MTWLAGWLWVTLGEVEMSRLVHKHGTKRVSAVGHAFAVFVVEQRENQEPKKQVVNWLFGRDVVPGFLGTKKSRNLKRIICLRLRSWTRFLGPLLRSLNRFLSFPSVKASLGTSSRFDPGSF